MISGKIEVDKFAEICLILEMKFGTVLVITDSMGWVSWLEIWQRRAVKTTKNIPKFTAISINFELRYEVRW